MTSKFEKVLSESLSLPTETKELIQEAWNEQLTEAKEMIAAELREEFAQKFEYDKGVLTEAMDKFLNDKISAEMLEFARDKKDLVAERVKCKKSLKEHVELLDAFLTDTIASEIKELREDRRTTKQGVEKLEKFLLQQLSEEIAEFHSDKQQLVQQKVKMIREGKRELVKAKRAFVEKAAELIESNITKILSEEIKQYRNDIIAARENDFGRRIFESFVAEFMTSYLNEGTEVKKMQRIIESKDRDISALEVSVAEMKTLTESATVKLNAANDRIVREKIMAELLAPLGKEKKVVMKELLESVKTNRLTESFNKYLPAVLNESNVKYEHKARVLTEGRVEKTGVRASSVVQDSSAIDLDQIKKLAGIK